MPRRSRRLRERQDAMETVEDLAAMENAMDTEGDAMPIEYAPSYDDSEEQARQQREREYQEQREQARQQREREQREREQREREQREREQREREQAEHEDTSYQLQGDSGWGRETSEDDVDLENLKNALRHYYKKISARKVEILHGKDIGKIFADIPSEEVIHRRAKKYEDNIGKLDRMLKRKYGVGLPLIYGVSGRLILQPPEPEEEIVKQSKLETISGEWAEWATTLDLERRKDFRDQMAELIDSLEDYMVDESGRKVPFHTTKQGRKLLEIARHGLLRRKNFKETIFALLTTITKLPANLGKIILQEMVDIQGFCQDNPAIFTLITGASAYLLGASQLTCSIMGGKRRNKSKRCRKCNKKGGKRKSKRKNKKKSKRRNKKGRRRNKSKRRYRK